MEIRYTEIDYALVKLNIDELIILNNALNEVCHALDIREFSTRMGAQLEEVEELLDQIGETIDTMRKTK
jgi:hypothetical protein